MGVQWEWDSAALKGPRPLLTSGRMQPEISIDTAVPYLHKHVGLDLIVDVDKEPLYLNT